MQRAVRLHQLQVGLARRYCPLRWLDVPHSLLHIAVGLYQSGVRLPIERSIALPGDTDGSTALVPHVL